jgi:hypothetical protein
MMENNCIGCLADNGNCGHQINSTIKSCPRIIRLKKEDLGREIKHLTAERDALKAELAVKDKVIDDMAEYIVKYLGCDEVNYHNGCFSDCRDTQGYEDRAVKCVKAHFLSINKAKETV